MSGLRFYADLFAKWIENLGYLWGVLNTNVLTFIDNLRGDMPLPGGGFVNRLSPLASFLRFIGVGDFTVLEFLFSVMGFSFGFYFLISLIIWLTDIIG